MGGLHRGHAQLIRSAAASRASTALVSIFVNPLQFGAGEDLSRYPRTLAEDIDLADAYERLILDFILKNQTNFVRTSVTISPYLVIT